MTLDTFFTPESIAHFKELWQQSTTSYGDLLGSFADEYRLNTEMLAEFNSWFLAFRNTDLPQMLGCSLSRLRAEGLAGDVTGAGTQNARSLKHVYQLVLPKLRDIERDLDGNVQCVWAEVRVTLDVTVDRHAHATPEEGAFAHVQAPDGARDVSIVDLHFYEGMPEVADARLGDLEKVHVKYLTWTDASGVVGSDIIYIGVGTGEPYGTAFDYADKRPRVYELDEFDQFLTTRWTYRTEGTWCSADIKEACAREHITSERAEIVYAVDPISEEKLFVGHLGVLQLMAERLKAGIISEFEFHLIVLERHRTEHLDDPACRREFDRTGRRSLEQVMWEVAEVYPYYVAAFFLPLRLLLNRDDEQPEDGARFRRYYLRLPNFRRKEYEVLRLRSEVLKQCGIDDPDVSMPALFADASMQTALQDRCPDDFKQLRAWLQYSVISDLEEYGIPPACRLAASLFIVALLHRTGKWETLIHAAHVGRMYNIDVSLLSFSDA